MLTKNINEMKAEIAKHIKADAVIRGSYWDEDRGKGCFIGCLTHSRDADILTDKYGIPLAIVYLLEGIFEALPKKESVVFFKDIGDAIDVDNKDLSLIHYSFLRDMLKRLPEITETTQDVINGLDLLAEGKDWSQREAVSAKARSWAAVRSVADACAEAVWSACAAANLTRYVDEAACAADAAWAASAAWDADISWPATSAASTDACAKERRLQAQSILELIKNAPIMEDNNAN